jgi:acetyl-CoA carboxylase biotin carboxyl carrier protein
MSDQIDFEQVREAIRIATEADLAELEVESATLKVRVRRIAPQAARNTAVGEDMQAKAPSTDAAVGAGAARQPSTPGEDHLEPIVAPMVGTFYRSASPDAPPFVEEGDVVEKGQTFCIIEAMKLFNEIPADKRGRIVRILAENASPVEFGQPLVLIEPS